MHVGWGTLVANRLGQVGRVGEWGGGWGKTFNIVVGMVFQMGSTFLATLWFPLSRVAFAVDVAGHLGAGT